MMAAALAWPWGWARLAARLRLPRIGGFARRAGRVDLVGAGPGPADLLTLRAARLIAEADVVFHDRLVSEEVLALAGRQTQFIYVGKRRAHHCVPQSDINALLVRHARAGRRVVRLKGGDPFVFGRGGEEAEACRAAGIACAVVPGITAALACAAGQGIPLTHRDCARMLTFVTGHTRDGVLDLDFAALARPGQTLAVYMGIATLPALLDGLVGQGFDPATPAAFIENGATPQERCLRGGLAQVVAQAPGWVACGPALLLVGEVVALGATAAVEAGMMHAGV